GTVPHVQGRQDRSGRSAAQGRFTRWPRTQDPPLRRRHGGARSLCGYLQQLRQQLRLRLAKPHRNGPPCAARCISGVHRTCVRPIPPASIGFSPADATMDLPSHEPHADPREQARLDRGRFFRALFAVVAFVSALWWIELIGNWIGSGFGGLGVAPRTLSGLIGILTSPLVHGSVGHLINNTLPLIVLGTLALAIY